MLALLLGVLGTGISPAGDAAPSSLGTDLYRRLACHGCHSLQGQGGQMGPALDRLGSRLHPEELKTQLLTPRLRQADSRMPSFAFIRPFELRALLDYLQSEL